MKKFLVFFAVLVFSAAIFAATLKDAQDRISVIEEFKTGISNASADGFFSDEENQTLNLLYQILEGEEYTATSLDGEISLHIGEYSLLETKWPAELEGSFFDGKITYERSIDILYSDAMEKKYIPESEMTEYQRRNYEYYINDYESRLRAGEKFFYAELTFKVSHWQGPAEYRFEPVALKIYKNSKRPRPIITLDETDSKEIFQVSERREFRTAKQLAENSAQIKKILKNESKSASQEKEKKRANSEKQKGRRAFYISAETAADNLNFSFSELTSYTIENMYGTLSLGLGKFIFAGVSAGISLPSIGDEEPAIYSFGGSLGANFNIKGFLRPYAHVAAHAQTDDSVILKAGTGIDLILGKFMMNLEYNYNHRNNVQASEDDSPENFSSYTAGIGFTW
ncbi:hypothetical protein [Treponema sp.]|uniref:hypothetical protein n=1 Tax=Treponema sp. TaxID=166 RepID=UPI003F0AF3D5